MAVYPQAENEQTEQQPAENNDTSRWTVSEVVWPTDEDPDPRGLYVEETRGHRRRLRKILTFTHSSTKAAGIMLIAAVVSIIVANTSAYGHFLGFWQSEFSIGIDGHTANISLGHIVNDVLMAIFFLLVGLEIKYEFVVGELSNVRQAALPIIAALGGVITPVAIYLLFNAGNPETSHGWGIPTATDIAFALGVLALLGDRVPSGIKVFLSTLAVADDIIAILVIAIFYGQTPSLPWLLLAGGSLIALVIINRAHVFSLVPYICMGAVLWFCTYMSGIHSTIAGVALAFTIPSGSSINFRNFINWSHDHVHHARDSYDNTTPVIAQQEYIVTIGSLSYVAKQAIPPATRLRHVIHPWVYFAILPLFALANADVSVAGSDLGNTLLSPVTMGVFFGLLLGKPLGIMLFSFLTVKLRIAQLPENVTWSHMLGAALLGGVGFTMSIFVATLSFADASLVTDAKLGILMASALAGILGFAYLYFQARKTKEHDVSQNT